MVIYTYGVWDLFHQGHLIALESLCRDFSNNELHIGVFTDEVAKSFKRKPIMNFGERMTMVDYIADLLSLQYSMNIFVTIQDNIDPEMTDNFLNYDIDNVIFAKGKGARFEDYATERPNYILRKYNEGISTSEIIKRIKTMNNNN